MRIPAERCYLGNAMLTLDGICEHFSVCNESRDRIRLALENALNSSIELSYEKASGLFDLKFSVFRDKLQITVEDFMLNDEISQIEAPSDEILMQKFNYVVSLADDFKLFRENGRNSCYSMQFNLVLVE